MEGQPRVLARITELAQSILRFVQDGLFPNHCAACGKEGFVVCPVCWQGIAFTLAPRMVAGYTVWSVANYHHPAVRAVVHALKYGQRREARLRIEEAIERWPARALFADRPRLLVPIPMPARRRRVRGGDSAALLADTLSAVKLGECMSVLVRAKNTASQTTLNRSERAQNVRGAFRVLGVLDPRASYVVVDDVVTTGATLGEAMRTLQAAGATDVLGWAFAQD